MPSSSVPLLLLAIRALLVLCVGICPEPASASLAPAQYALGHYPFYDLCNGKIPTSCVASSSCTWSVQYSPVCTNRALLQLHPPRVDPTNFIAAFFTFNWGVHLNEGSTTRAYYNMDLESCARECIKSAGGLPALDGSQGLAKVRCLSFDFYPFEDPQVDLPLGESMDRGICSLNTDNRDTARLRNEDQGFTQAEWYYKSHFSKRPFSPLSGYYEVRDPRGGALANFLQYGGSPLSGLQSIQHVWGQSRWGIFHTKLPEVLNQVLDCNVPGNVSGASTNSTESDVVFAGGFCPVNGNQHCPGLVSKLDADALCTNAGGRLCADQTEADLVAGAKTGCSFDGWPVWTADLDSSGPPRFPRCCAEYSTPIACSLYAGLNILVCAKFKTASACINGGSSARFLPGWGMGNRLSQFRQTCGQQFLGTGQPCRNLLVQDWMAMDSCVWCPSAGQGPSGGAGQCLPGNDFGICQKSSAMSQTSFSTRIKAACPVSAICALVNHKGYGYLRGLINVPSQSPTQRPTPVPAPPTSAPVPTIPPTVSCAKWRTAAKCSRMGCSWSPKLCSPSGPGANPTTARPTSTAKPTNRPSPQPTGQPTQTQAGLRTPSLSPIISSGNADE
jgi:hypothetical protein